jgi:O-methyltransferase
MDNAFIATYFAWDHRTPHRLLRGVNKVLRKLRIRAQVTPPPPHMANVEARMNIFHLASQTAAYGIAGDVVEIGCNAGESSIVIRRVLDVYAPDKEFHVFDSFQGLPELGSEDARDGVYNKGAMVAGADRLRRNFQAVGLKLPHIHEGWFEDTVPACLPDRISFALIDGDLYSSTRHVLPHVYQRMSPGAIGFFGVYYDASVLPREHTPVCFRSPGVKRACDEFFADKPEKVSVLYANEYTNGYFRKLDEV